MPQHSVDIAIIGAGSAGISAFKLLRKHKADVVLIDGGPLGTTCARVGCMPSKALVEIAGRYAGALSLKKRGVLGCDCNSAVDGGVVMQEVRRLRDHFSNGLRDQVLQFGPGKFLQGYARFLDADTLEVAGERIQARSIILATGSRPSLPGSLQNLSQLLLNSESFFELDAIPAELAVVGLGSVGLELGQACGILGAKVWGVDLQQRLGCLTDPAAIREACTSLGQSMDVSLGHHPVLQQRAGRLEVRYADQCITPGQVLLSAGRTTNLDDIGLDSLLRANHIDAHSLQLGNLPIFVAGDCTGQRALLHEAVDEGQIAAINALNYPRVRHYQRRVPLQITFTRPQLACVGMSYAELDIHSALIAEVSLAQQGRVVLSGGGDGVLRLYACSSGKLMGAELVSPQAEHLAHIVAAWLSAGFSVDDALRQPFYHPTLEEALRSALIQLQRKLGDYHDDQPDLSFL